MCYSTDAPAVLLEIDDTEFDSVISPTHSVASTTKNEESDISPLHSIGVSSPWEANNALDEHLPIKGDQERIQKETKKPSSQAQPGAANAADSAPPDTSSDSKCESQDNTDGDVPYIISSWTPSDVSAWLTENGYPSGIVDLFLREAIDGKRLCVLLKLCYQLNLFKATDQLGEDELVQMGEAATDIYRKETILLIAKLELSREMHRMLHNDFSLLLCKHGITGMLPWLPTSPEANVSSDPEVARASGNTVSQPSGDS